MFILKKIKKQNNLIAISPNKIAISPNKREL